MGQLIGWLGNLLIIVGLVFTALGIYGTFRFNDFFQRILITSKIDTVGFLTIMLGVILKMGFSYFSLKVFIVLILFLVTNPISSHAILRSADLGEYKTKEER